MPIDPTSADVARRVQDALAAFVAETHPTRARVVTLESDFEHDLGLDSVARMEFCLRLQALLGEGPPDAAVNESTSARHLLALWAGAPQAAATAVSAMPGASTVPAPAAATTLLEVLAWHALQEPQRRHVLLLTESGATEEIRYGALFEDARRIAGGLLARGVGPGQNVALMLPTSRAYLAAFFGVMMTGAHPVPIYPPARAAQLAEHVTRHVRLLANAQTAVLITLHEARAVAALLPAVRQVLMPEDLRQAPPAPLHRARGGDTAFLQYTSGSTGDPKGVVLSHANVLANIRAMGRAVQVTSSDVFVSWLPLYHDMGLIGAWLGALYHGCPLVLLSPMMFLARPARWLRAVSDYRGTLTAAPNFAFEVCARKMPDADLAGLELSCLRAVFNGAEPVSPDTLEAFAQRFAPCGLRREAITPVYGLAENTVGLAFPPLGRGPRIDVVDREALSRSRIAQPVAANTPSAARLPACGRALAGHEMRVADEAGHELPERAVGRVQFRGPSATAGYFHNPRANQTLFVGDWLDTGDYGYLFDAEIYLTGRAKDLIIRGGRNLYPYELEDAVGALPGVRRGCVAVFGAQDATHATEKLVVVAETREASATARDALHAAIQRAAVALLGAPADEVMLVPPHTVLKTSSGKIRRAAIRERYEQGMLGMPVAAWRRAIALLWPALRGRLARAGQWVFGVWALACLALLTAVVWPAVVLPRRPLWGAWVVHGACRALLRLTGARPPRVRATQVPGRAHVLVANHASYADVLLLCAALPPGLHYAFVAKRELFDNIWTRWFLQGLGTVFVARGLALQSTEEASAMAEALKDGRSLIVFPEATFTRETGLRAFHLGAFVAAAHAGAPVATAALTGTREVLRDRTYLPRRGHMTLELGTVLVPTAEDWAAAVRLRDLARAEVLRLCGEPDVAH